MVHIITTAQGPVTPVGIERAVTDSSIGVARAAAVGVGPAGAQVVVVVVEEPSVRPGLAPAEALPRRLFMLGKDVQLRLVVTAWTTQPH